MGTYCRSPLGSILGHIVLMSSLEEVEKGLNSQNQGILRVLLLYISPEELDSLQLPQETPPFDELPPMTRNALLAGKRKCMNVVKPSGVQIS